MLDRLGTALIALLFFVLPGLALLALLTGHI